MKCNYRELMEEIHVPEQLNDRVLSAVRQQGNETKRRRLTKSLWRAAACAVLALTLVVGGISLRPREQTLETPDSSMQPYALTLTAKAAGMGANGGVLLQASAGQNLTKLDGTVQTLALTFADGREETGTYHLRTETLRTFVNEDGSEVLAPALEGETAETVFGIYAVPTEESRWFLWPVEGSNTVSLSAPYGKREIGAVGETVQTRFHSGIDIRGEQGLNIMAAAAGTVTETGYDAARGNYLILDHGGGLTTLYGQCQEVLVKSGDTVKGGEVVALLGATGMATGPHLHFEVRQDGEAQNPVAYFERAIRDTLKMG